MLAVAGGHAEWAVRRRKRRTLATNIAHALGAPPTARAVRRAARREVVNEAHRSADLLWALGKPDAFVASLELDGLEHARELADAGCGFILAGLHLGGWELATSAPQRLLSTPVTAIVADDWLAWAIEHMRVSVGMRIAYRTAPVGEFGRILREGGALVVFGDDAWGDAPRMHTVRFLDACADLPAGIVTLARLHQAPIVTFVVVRVARRRWRLEVSPPVAPPPRRASAGTGFTAERATMQQLADRWTAIIRAHPDQWAASFRIRWRDGHEGAGT